MNRKDALRRLLEEVRKPIVLAEWGDRKPIPPSDANTIKFRLFILRVVEVRNKGWMIIQEAKQDYLKDLIYNPDGTWGYETANAHIFTTKEEAKFVMESLDH